MRGCAKDNLQEYIDFYSVLKAYERDNNRILDLALNYHNID